MTAKHFCSIALFCLAVAKAVATPEIIRPTAIWNDNRGKHIQAHGGGIIKIANTFYWFGEDRSADNDPNKRYVACYSSTDLAHWTFRNQVLQLAAPEGFGSKWVIERPKVFYNPQTRKYVMYMHMDAKFQSESGYGLARVGVAVCDTVDGNYNYLRSFRPFDMESRDIGEFIDDDGSAYLLFESRPARGIYIAKLSSDYLDLERVIGFVEGRLEAGALVHYNGLYYFIASQLSSWAPNPNVYATAASLRGPWTEFKHIAPPETKTYSSQSTFLLKIVGSKKTSVIFMGDIWKPKTQWDSRYLWMPLEIGNGKMWLPSPQPWSIDVETGETTINPS